jgi:hypothetical protein
MLRTLACTNTAAFTYFKVRFKPASPFPNALGWAIQPAGGAFDTFFPIHHRSLSTPVTGFNFGILGGNRAQVIGDFRLIKRLFSLSFHCSPFVLFLSWTINPKVIGSRFKVLGSAPPPGKKTVGLMEKKR